MLKYMIRVFIILLFLSACSCLGVTRLRPNDSTPVTQGQVHFLWNSRTKRVSGSANIAMNRTGLFRCEIVDPTGTTLYIILIKQSQMKIYDLANRCYVSMEDLSVKTERFMGIPVDGEQLYRLLCMDPWPDRVTRKMYRKDAVDVLEVAFFPETADQFGSLLLDLRNIETKLEITWDSRGYGNLPNMMTIFHEDRFLWCEREWVSSFLGDLL